LSGGRSIRYGPVVAPVTLNLPCETFANSAIKDRTHMVADWTQKSECARLIVTFRLLEWILENGCETPSLANRPQVNAVTGQQASCNNP